jgi:hypothetical protein
VQKLPPSADQGKQEDGGKSGVQPAAPFPKGLEPRDKTSRFYGTHETSPSATSVVTADNLEDFFSSLKNQEATAQDLTRDVSFFPPLTDWEQQLVYDCVVAADDRWTPSLLRKVLATPLMREISAQQPELVGKALRIAARDPGTTSPRRLLTLGRCPHWSRAATELAIAAQAAELDAEPDRGSKRTPAEPAWPAPPAPAQRAPDLAAMFAASGLRFGTAREDADASAG